MNENNLKEEEKGEEKK
ncbi:hypothetical protein cmbei_8005515 [Cryptosporidium meleagridis]